MIFAFRSLANRIGPLSRRTALRPTVLCRAGNVRIAVTLAVVLSLRILVGVASAVPPVYDHVVVVFEENKDYTEVIGSPSAPYINQLRRAACRSRACSRKRIPARPTIFGPFPGQPRRDRRQPAAQHALYYPEPWRCPACRW